MADIADYRLVFHFQHMFVANDVEVTSGGYKDVYLIAYVLDRDHAEAFHRSLQGADRIDLGHHDGSAQAFQGLCTALADVTVAQHQRNLAGDHHVGGALDTIDQRFATAVEIVKF